MTTSKSSTIAEQHILAKEPSFPENLQSDQEILHYLKENFSKFRDSFKKTNTSLTKQKIRSSVNEDIKIIQLVSAIKDLETTINHFSKRLREWYSYFLPALNEAIKDNEKYAKLIAEKTKKDIIRDLKLNDEMGAVPSKEDRLSIKSLASTILSLTKEKNLLVKNLDSILKKYARNLATLLGSLITAKLIKEAGSLKRLSQLPSSTLQLLGAEAALFRHLRTGAKCPKYGHIISHTIIARAKNKGKAARILADKASICAKLDYFKGEFLAEGMLKELNSMKL